MEEINNQQPSAPSVEQNLLPLVTDEAPQAGNLQGRKLSFAFE